MKTFPNIILFILLIFSYIFYSCEESLPKYQEPTNVLIGRIIKPINQSEISFNIFEDHSYEPPKIRFLGDSTIHVRIEIENIFDDVIVESTYVTGNVKLQVVNDEENIIVHNIVKTDLNRYSSYLEIPKGGKVYLDVKCKLKNTRGYYFWSGKSYQEYPPGYVTYTPITLKITADVKLYKKLGYIKTNSVIVNVKVAGNIYYPG